MSIKSQMAEVWSNKCFGGTCCHTRTNISNPVLLPSLVALIPLSLRSISRYPSINSPTFVVDDNGFDVTKGKSKDYYTLLIRKTAKLPNIIHKIQSNFNFTSDHLKQMFKLPRLIDVESYVKAFQYKVINSILYTNTKLHKIGFRTK